MRKALFELGLLVFAVTGLHVVKFATSGFINGSVTPEHFSQEVIAVNGNDSVKTISENGSFAMMLKPGIWRIVLKRNQRQTCLIRDQVMVESGEKINLGQIRLSQ